MNKECKRKLNNNGSVLVGVIIIITVVGILAASLFTMVSVNSQMKIVDKKSKDTFYSAETALDEITLGLQNCLATSTKDAYGYLLVNYLSEDITKEERDENFKNKVADNLIEELKKDTGVTSSSSVDEVNAALVEKMRTYFSISDRSVVDITSFGGFEKSTDNKSVLFKAIEVLYNNGSYSNSIITDIRIILPDAAFTVDLPYTSELPFQTFGIIANKEVNVDYNCSLDLKGDLYAGKDGINVTGSGRFDAKASKVISAGDIHIKNVNRANEDFSAVKIEKLKDNTPVNIWAQNILVDSSGSQALNLNGKRCYDFNAKYARVHVADDLTLASKRSKVKIDGSYFGFGSSLVNESSSSAIMLNGREANLDLSNCQTLMVAGRAFIGASDYVTSEQRNNFIDLPTGESISVRGNQIAYLVPSKCVSVKHNPVNANEANVIENSMSNPAKSFDWDACDEDGLKLRDYIDSSNPVLVSRYRVPNTASGVSIVTYYYLNIDVNKKDDFFVNYCKVYGTSKMASIFTLDGLATAIGYDADGNVTNSSQISTNGAAVADYQFDEDSLDYKEEVVKANGSAEAIAEAGTYASQYSWFKAVLRSSKDDALDEVFKNRSSAEYAAYKTRTVVENIINFDLINELAPTPGSVAMDCTDAESGTRALIINGDYTVKGKGNKGIIIATGDITFEDNSEFTGLVISGSANKGVATIKNNVNVIADERIVTMILGDTENFIVNYTDRENNKQKAQVGDFFMDPRAGMVSYTPTEDEDNEETETQNLADLVIYENWVKN